MKGSVYLKILSEVICFSQTYMLLKLYSKLLMQSGRDKINIREINSHICLYFKGYIKILSKRFTDFRIDACRPRCSAIIASFVVK